MKKLLLLIAAEGQMATELVEQVAEGWTWIAPE
jgi:hypothetical protein